MTWLAVPLGMLTGAVLGALGGGGAILTIPVLIYVLGLDPHAATTASLVIVGISALAAVPGHLRRHTARVGVALILATVGIIGTYAGSLASAAVPSPVLVVLLGSLLAVVGALMLRNAPRSGTGDRAAAPRPADSPGTTGAAGLADAADASEVPAADWVSGISGVSGAARVAAAGVGVGLLTGFFGVGGGFAIVPALTLVLGFPVRLAVGTSLVVIALNSSTAFVARLGQGVSLDWTLVGLFTVAAYFGSLIGGALGHRTSSGGLSRAFAVLLFVVAAYMLVSAVLTR